jgi:hypothetical protein
MACSSGISDLTSGLLEQEVQVRDLFAPALF